jgi:hypothetical protein
MKKQVQSGLILGMIFLAANALGQSNGLVSDQTNIENKTPKTYLDLVFNIVGTNLNYGKQNSELTDYKKAVLGAQVGASFQAGITPGFSIVPELYFMMKGGSLQANNPLTAGKTTVRLYSFELPVLARFHFGRVHLNAGPSIAYNFYGTKETEGTSTSFAFENSVDGFKHWEAGAQIGGGYTFQTKRKRVALDIRYNYGLTNIAYKGEMYNRSLVISLHFSKAWKNNPLARR